MMQTDLIGRGVQTCDGKSGTIRAVVYDQEHSYNWVILVQVDGGKLDQYNWTQIVIEGDK